MKKLGVMVLLSSTLCAMEIPQSTQQTEKENFSERVYEFYGAPHGDEEKKPQNRDEQHKEIIFLLDSFANMIDACESEKEQDGWYIAIDQATHPIFIGRQLFSEDLMELVKHFAAMKEEEKRQWQEIISHAFKCKQEEGIQREEFFSYYVADYLLAGRVANNLLTTAHQLNTLLFSTTKRIEQSPLMNELLCLYLDEQERAQSEESEAEGYKENKGKEEN